MTSRIKAIGRFYCSELHEKMSIIVQYKMTKILDCKSPFLFTFWRRQSLCENDFWRDRHRVFLHIRVAISGSEVSRGLLVFCEVEPGGEGLAAARGRAGEGQVIVAPDVLEVRIRIGFLLVAVGLVLGAAPAPLNPVKLSQN